MRTPLPTMMAGAILLGLAVPAGAGTGPGTWDELGPFGRISHALLHDVAHDRLLLVAGSPGVPGEVWMRSLSVNGATWSRMPSGPGLPIAGSPRSFAVDAVHDRLLMFGGTAASEVWALPLTGAATWSLLQGLGTPPPPRSPEGVFFDAEEDRLLVFGGVPPGGGTALTDFWELRLSPVPTWAPLATFGTPTNEIVHLDFDPLHRELVALTETANLDSTEVWALDLGTQAWERRTIATLEGAPVFSALALVPARRRIVAAGGWNHAANAELHEIASDGSPGGWTFVTADGTPRGRAFGAAVYDALRDRILVHGGLYGQVNDNTMVIRGDLWALSRGAAAAWSPLDGASGLPIARQDHRAIVDEPGDRMIVYGGEVNEDASSSTTGVWAYPLAGNESWQKLEPLGSAPPVRTDCGAIFDPVRRRLVIFGGRAPNGEPPVDAAIWVLALDDPPAWSPLSASGPGPSLRAHPLTVYDPVGDRMILHGGFTASLGFPGGDTWALSLSGPPAWSDLAPGGTPTNANGFSAGIYDPLRHRVVAFGRMNSFGEVFDNTVWALTIDGIPAWSQLAPTGTAPVVREGAAVVYDPSSDRVIVEGGRDPATPSGRLLDTWALDLAVDPPHWSQLSEANSTLRARFGHSAVYDAARDRIVTFAGKRPTGMGISKGDLRQDLWALRWSEPVGVPPSERAAALLPRIESISPNPAYGALRIAYARRGGQSAWLSVHDLRGRLVAERVLSSDDSSSGVLVLDPAVLPGAGIYFVRLREGRHVATARICFLR